MSHGCSCIIPGNVVEPGDDNLESITTIVHTFKSPLAYIAHLLTSVQ